MLAFLVPLALVVQHLARERALADAERQTAVVVAVLAVTTDPAAVERAISTSELVNADRIAVHDLSTGPPGPTGKTGATDAIGSTHARADEVRLTAGQRRPAVVPVAGGVAYLEPVDLGSGGTAVVEVFVPDGELTRGVDSAWIALGSVAAFLARRLGTGKRPAGGEGRRIRPRTIRGGPSRSARAISR